MKKLHVFMFFLVIGCGIIATSDLNVVAKSNSYPTPTQVPTVSPTVPPTPSPTPSPTPTPTPTPTPAPTYIIRQHIGANQFIRRDPYGDTDGQGQHDFNDTFETFMAELPDTKYKIFRIKADNYELDDATIRSQMAQAITSARGLQKHVRISFSIFEDNPYTVFRKLENSNPSLTLENYLIKTYESILDRTPASAEVQGWVSYISSTGKPKWEVYQEFLNSFEYQNNANNKPNLYTEINPCTSTRTGVADTMFVVRAFTMLKGYAPTCADFNYLSGLINETQRLELWKSTAQTLMSVIGNNRNVSVSLLNEGDFMDMELGYKQKEGQFYCPIKSPLYTSSHPRTQSYIAYLNSRIAKVREVVPTDIEISVNAGAHTYRGYLAHCRDWATTPNETLEQMLDRVHRFFDGIQQNVSNFSFNFYPGDVTEAATLEPIMNDLKNRYPTKSDITVEETGYNTGSCNDTICENTRRDVIQAIIAAAQRVNNIPALILYYNRQTAGYGIKTTDGTAKSSYNVLPQRMDMTTTVRPAWCVNPILENGLSVCDWYYEASSRYQ